MSAHAGPTPVRQLNSDYDKWNEAICERYFPVSGKGRPTYLALDEEELSELAPVVGVSRDEALESFVSSILVESRPPIPIWRPFIQAMANWRYEGSAGLPPYIGLLGLCVIAASQMETDRTQGIGGHAYYPRLKALLGLEPTTGMPDGFERVRDLWHDLDVWLREDLQGARGLSTVRSHPRLSNIGWPLSQCILRAADRNRLPDFFRAVDLAPGDQIANQRLLVLFRAWAARSQLLTGPALRLIARDDEAVEEELMGMVQRELAAWDGSLRDARGRRRAGILARIERFAGGRKMELSFVVPRPEGFPEGSFRAHDGRELKVTDGGDGWYGDLDLPPTKNLLAKGISFANSSFALTLDPSPVIPLRASYYPPGWVEVPQATLADTHMLLVQTGHADSVEDFLKRHASAGWRAFQPQGNLPNGWKIFDRVSIRSAPVEFDQSLSRLIPRLNVASRLEGGLPVSRGIYLRDGEPDLWVDVGSESGASIKLPTGVLPLKPGVQQVRLSEQSLPTGEITLDAAGVTRHFETIETFGEISPAATTALVHVVEGKVNKPTANSAVARERVSNSGNRHLVAGASVSQGDSGTLDSGRPPVVVPAGWNKYFFLGKHPGELWIDGPQNPPNWLARQPKATFQFVEFDLDFDAQLLIVRGTRDKDTLKTRLLVKEVASRPEVPCLDGTPSAEAAGWVEAILEIAGKGPDVPEHLEVVWSSYAEAAVEIKRGLPDSP
jgi:hypothetical protein